jgi:hypothetical protein
MRTLGTLLSFLALLPQMLLAGLDHGAISGSRAPCPMSCCVAFADEPDAIACCCAAEPTAPAPHQVLPTSELRNVLPAASTLHSVQLPDPPWADGRPNASRPICHGPSLLTAPPVRISVLFCSFLH